MQTSKVVLKRGDVFLVSKSNGRIDHEVLGAGLYFMDTRFLSRYSFRLNGQDLELLDSSAEHNNVSLAQFANPLLHDAANVDVLPQTIGVHLFREIESGMHEQFDLRNFNDFPVSLTFELHFSAEFRDIFDIRGFRVTERGAVLKPRFHGNDASLRYRSRDGALMETRIHFNRPPESITIETTESTPHEGEESDTMIPGQDRIVSILPHEHPVGFAVKFHIDLDAHSGDRVAFRLVPVIRFADEKDAEQPAFSLLFDDAEAPHERFASVVTSNDLLNRVLDRSLRDIHTLITPFPGGRLVAAGVPWYVAPFGRDSLIAALQMLMFSPEIAVETLRFLARKQGSKVDDWTEEEPGKILHEERFGEMARSGDIPHTPYYGTVDATPLFVILFAEVMRWTGDRALFDELYPHVERALQWIDQYGDSDGDGFVDYGQRSSEGLVNQGWKDSDNSLQFPDHSTVVAPVALVEVQGYVYQAWQSLATILDQFGSPQRASELRERAEHLRAHFETSFWDETLGFYGQAIDGSGRLVPSISSNPGHCLFAGIVAPSRAEAIATHLMSPDMFSGWGVRTLSNRMPSFNPMSYHNGSVWPHDNGLIAAGLRNYGQDEQAAAIASGLLAASTHFDYLRLPELFCGFSWDFERYSSPVAYPVSCSPQAWAAGATPHLLQSLLGLDVDAANRRLWLRPYLPDWLEEVRIRGMRFAGESVDLLIRGHGTDVDAELTSGGDVLLVVGNDPQQERPRRSREQDAS